MNAENTKPTYLIEIKTETSGYFKVLSVFGSIKDVGFLYFSRCDSFTISPRLRARLYELFNGGYLTCSKADPKEKNRCS